MQLSSYLRSPILSSCINPLRKSYKGVLFSGVLLFVSVTCLCFSRALLGHLASSWALYFLGLKQGMFKSMGTYIRKSVVWEKSVVAVFMRCDVTLQHYTSNTTKNTACRLFFPRTHHNASSSPGVELSPESCQSVL